jgi:hypothetical protein
MIAVAYTLRPFFFLSAQALHLGKVQRRMDPQKFALRLAPPGRRFLLLPHRFISFFKRLFYLRADYGSVKNCSLVCFDRRRVRGRLLSKVENPSTAYRKSFPISFFNLQTRLKVQELMGKWFLPRYWAWHFCSTILFSKEKQLIKHAMWMEIENNNKSTDL